MLKERNLEVQKPHKQGDCKQGDASKVKTRSDSDAIPGHRGFDQTLMLHGPF